VRQSEIDQGKREGLSSSERERLKQLERENHELKQAKNKRCRRDYFLTTFSLFM